MRPIRIVYITPDYPNGHSWEGLWAGYLEANRHKEEGDEAQYFNLFYDDKWDAIHAAYDADIVAFTATSPQYKRAKILKTEIMDAWLSASTQDIHALTKPYMVIGGPHASALKGHLANDGWDRVIAGEGERDFAHITKAIRGGREFSMPLNLWPLDINAIKEPDRHLIKQERHIQQAYQDEGRRVCSILSSRGCPFHCDFCISHSVWGRRPRLRDAHHIIHEMKTVKSDWNVDFVKFSDDTFNLSWERNSMLFDLMEQNNIMEWGCNINPAVMLTRKAPGYRKELERMYDAGCREIWVGVESGSLKVRKAMKKADFSDIGIINLFKWARRVGLKTRAYWIIGHPTESIKDLLRTKDLAARCGADINGVTILCPFPGTVHYIDEQMKDWDWSQCDEYWNPYWKTQYFTNEQLKAHQKGLVRHFAEIGELVIKHRRQADEDSHSQ